MIINFKKKAFSLSSTYLIDHIKVIASIFFILIVTSCLFLDKPLAIFFTDLSFSIKAPFLAIEKLFCPMLWILAPQAIFFYIRFFLKKEKKSRKIWYVSLSIPLAIIACKILQLFFGKATPEWFFLHQETPFRFFEWNASFHSFPCMASVIIATFASSLSCLMSKSRAPLLLAGFFVSLFPVLSANAFLSDALAGFLLGSLSAQWIFRKMKREASL